MGVLEDGTGKGFKQKVDSEHRASIVGTADAPLEHSSAEGDAAFFTSTFATGTTDVEVMSIQNTESSRQFHITRLLLTSTVATLWTVIEVTSGTPAGTPLVYVNPNFQSGTTRNHTSFDNAAVTGTVVGDTLLAVRSAANVTEHVFLEGAVILGNGDTFAITADADGTVHVLVIGFWEEAL